MGEENEKVWQEHLKSHLKQPQPERLFLFVQLTHEHIEAEVNEFLARNPNCEVVHRSFSLIPESEHESGGYVVALFVRGQVTDTGKVQEPEHRTDSPEEA